VAARVAEYALFTCPPGSDVVVICTGFAPAAAIVMLRLVEAVCASELESVTCTANEDPPACVGVPEICPLGESVRPGGNEPDVMDQVYGTAPPVADKVAE
jgi:hypothetical protein